MTIVHIVEPFAAGVATFVKSLTEAMPNDQHIVIHGERKNVTTADQVKRNFFSNNVHFIKWEYAQRSINPVKDIAALTRLCNILKRLKQKGMIDAVHLHSSKSGLLGRIACRITKINNVFYTPNGASFLSAKSSFNRFFYKQVEKMGSRLGGKIVCCSLSELQEYLKLGIEASYVNNGVKINHSYNTILKSKNEKFRIVTNGRIEAQKGPQLFNEIASYFKDMDKIEFVWIGDGPDKKLLSSNNIHVTSWIDSKLVHELMSDSDIYLSTSKYEGLSFAVLEALSLRKPVLLSNCSGNRDIVKKGVNGGLFDSMGDAVTKILTYYNNPDMLAVMGNFSKEICATEFDAKENFKGYRELYAGTADNSVSSKLKWSFQ